VCHDSEQVSLARKHNNANILVLSGNRINIDEALQLVQEFIATEFEQGKHIRRIEKLDKLC
jgi:ribose 5-phosphate isomerase B